MADIFLSYQKRDRDLANRIAVALRAQGFSVWWDDELTPRESWDRTIEREIALADHVLVLWTRNAVESDWVRIEANYARNCVPSKLIQARFDNITIPIAFSMIQYVDLTQMRPDVGPSWQRMLSWLRPVEDFTSSHPMKSSDQGKLDSSDRVSKLNTPVNRRKGGFAYGTDSKTSKKPNVQVNSRGIELATLGAIPWTDIAGIAVSYSKFYIKIYRISSSLTIIPSWGRPGEFRRVVGAIVSWVDVVHE